MPRRVVALLKERLQVDPEDFPRIAVNALLSLAYKPSVYDRDDNKIIYVDPHEQQYGTDSWKCLYQATLTWEETDDGIELTIKVREKNYGEDHIDECEERVAEIWNQIERTVKRSRRIKKKEPPWKAKFATGQDLRQAGYISEINQTRVDDPREQATSFLLGSLGGKKVRLPERITHRHVLVCGPTGAGKSTAIFIPNLIERLGTSAIVTEAVSGDTPAVVYQATAGWRQLAGHQIIYFNPDDSHSMRINPVDLIKTFDDAQHLANLIINNTTAESHMGDQIWSQSETHLLQSLLLHVAGFRRDLNKPSEKGDNANIGYIRRFLRRGPEGMREELKNTRLPIARKEFEAYLNNSSPNFRFGVVSGLMARLTLFVNAKIAALTEVTDFSIEDLKEKLHTIYLATPINRPDYGPLAALIFNFVLSLVLKDIRKYKHPLTLLLDEFTNYGYLPGITRYLTVIRNAGVGAALGVQDPVQLEQVYREKAARILFGQPRTKVFFAPADDQLAFRISRMLGTTTEREGVTASGHLSNRETPRPLMDAPEITNLEKTQEFLVLSGIDPIKLKKLNAWEVYKDPIDREPPDRPEIHIDETLEHACEEAEKPPPWMGVANQETEKHKRQFEKKQPKKPSGSAAEAEDEEPPLDRGDKKARGEKSESGRKKKSYWDRLAEQYGGGEASDTPGSSADH